MYLKWTIHYLWSKLWKKIYILVQRLFWGAVVNSWYVFQSALRPINLYEISIQFLHHDWCFNGNYHFKMSTGALERRKKKKKRKGLRSAKRMLSYLKNKRVQFVLVGGHIHRFFCEREKMLDISRRYILLHAYHQIIYVIKNTPRVSSSTFLKVDIDIITTPRRSHLTQLPIVFYAEQSGGELR